MSIVRDATPYDAESIGEAHAEAWRIGYDELFPRAMLEAAVDVRRHMWVGLVGDPALGGTLLVAEEPERSLASSTSAQLRETTRSVRSMGFMFFRPRGGGSAQALMDRAVASLAESFTLAILWTHTEAERARRFYAKSRWTETGNHRRETTWDGLAFPAVEYERVLVSGRVPTD